MQAGRIFMINCETMIPNFKRDYDSKLCPLKDLLFDSKKMYDKEKKNYKDILKTGEDKDENGNPNLYFLKESISYGSHKMGFYLEFFVMSRLGNIVTFVFQI